MDRKDEELWLKKVRESLKDYSESPAKDGWKKLENELSPASAERRIYAYRIWTSAAVILLLAISAITLYFLDSPIADPIADEMPEASKPEAQTRRIEPTKAIAINSQPPSKRQVIEFIPPTIKENKEEENVSEEKEVTDIGTTQEPANIKEENKEKKATPTAPNRGKLNLPVEGSKKKKEKGKWDFAVSVNSSTGSALAGGNKDYSNVETTHHSNQFGLPNGAIVDNSTVNFVDGVPYIIENTQSANWDHHQPISFGLSVRKQLPNNFSVETGLTYTLLRSDMQTSGINSHKTEQKLHYIGIPVRANWSFVNTHSFTVYLSAGGMVEKCVYGKQGNEKHTVKPLQLSLNSGVGAQYNLTKQLGIYVEPGIAYFFDDGSKTETIRKERPFNFNLQAGVRFSY